MTVPVCPALTVPVCPAPSYTYDVNGNKLTESWTGVMAAWNFTTQNGGSDGYDEEDRFVSFIQSAQSKTIGLTRSNIGNITNVDLNGTSAARGYSNIHELTSIGAATQTFDTDGNLTVAHSGVDLAWDEAGMLKQTVVSAGDTAGIEGTNDYGYDASQKRVSKKITRNSVVVEDTVYIYAGPNCIAEYGKGAAASAPDREYVYAQAIDSLVMIVRNSGAQKLTVTRNQQWSVSALSDHATGTVLERYTYDVFGKRTILAADGTTVRATSSYDNPYGCTSRRHDEESGLMYFRARYYDPTTGEFSSQDPLEYVDGMSLYRGYFVPGAMDPTGESPVIIGAGAIAVVVACALPQYYAAMDRYGHRSDKYRHCWVSCRIGKSCGFAVNEIAGAGKEARDRAIAAYCKLRPNDKICQGGHGDFWDSIQDIAANHSCVYWEQYIFGLVGSWIGTACRESCEDCCDRHHP